jgi:TonB family protein
MKKIITILSIILFVPIVVFSQAVKPDEFPRYYTSECEEIENRKERNKCAERAFLNFIYKNLEYPDEARLKHIEGKVYIRFAVDKTGFVKEIVVLKGIGYGLDEAAMDVITLLGNWIPAVKNSENIDYNVVIPITFHLSK